ncbi:MAG: ATP-binding protein [Sphingomonas sp.]
MSEGAAFPGFGRELTETEMGREIAAADWSRSALGPPDRWPRSLVTLVSTLLSCPVPMFLAWGPELTSFYNDAYRPILGLRAGRALGQPFRVLWGDIWDDIGPLVDATLAGESTSVTDMKLDLHRQGKPEDSWWSFSYSPVHDDDGRVAGLFCVTGETTERVLAQRDREDADARLEYALSVGEGIGTWEWDVSSRTVTADARYAQLHGMDPAHAAAGAPASAFFERVHPEDQPRVRAALARAVEDRSLFREEYRLIGDGSVRWLQSLGRCMAGNGGDCVRFPGVSYDITERMRAVQALEAAKDERDFVAALTARQRDLGSPDAMLRLAVEALGVRFGADRCGYYRALPERRIRIGPVWSSSRMEPLSGEHDVDFCGDRVARAWDSGIAFSYSDAQNDPLGGLGSIAALGVRSGLSVPILRAGRFHSAFFLHSEQVREWSEGDIALVREVGELTMLAVERSEAMIRLQSRVEQQQNELHDQAVGRARAESQVRQLQKMEAVGQLTGGIAHDFNNMLAIVIGGLDLMERKLQRGDTDVSRYLVSAMDGATRAAALTQRLLAFSRQSPLDPEPIDLGALIAGLTEMLERTLGERVRLKTSLGNGLWQVHADSNQLESVIVNLAVNARDAMPDGGTLTVEGGNAHLDEAYARAEDVPEGQYVLLAITDTGIGMSPDVVAKAFDPFFTTKTVGKGTGLGLSQVFGFVRQSGGHVKILSEPGRGTTVKIFLPRYLGDAPVVTRQRASGQVLDGDPSEVILLVEDEARLREFAVEALRDLGYTVVHAADGEEAVAMIEAGQGATMLLTDVVMPGMNGRQLADIALTKIPGLKLLFITGYTRDAVVNDGVLDPGTNFLSKPFGIDLLAAKVREVLDD